MVPLQPGWPGVAFFPGGHGPGPLLWPAGWTLPGQDRGRRSVAMPEKSSHQVLQIEPQGDVFLGRFTTREALWGEAARAVGDRLSRLVAEGGCRKILLNCANLGGVVSGLLARLV